MSVLLNELLSPLRALFFPDRCALCHKVIAKDTKVCKNCRKTAPVIRGKTCHLCAMPEKECTCKKHSRYYKALTAPFIYKDVLKTGIHYWKFENYTASTDFFAEMIEASVKEKFADINFDYITFIPQTANETAEKGYNQTEILADASGRKLNIPVATLLVKLYETRRQHNTPALFKSGNVTGVFDCVQLEKIRGKNILLIDDIKTSGNTLNECAKMLSLYDAENVYCAVIATTDSRRK